MTLQQMILNRMKSGALLSVVIEPDEQLATEACRMAGEATTPGLVTIVSVLDPEFGDKLQNHKDKGRGTMIISDYLRVQNGNPVVARLLREFALIVRNNPPRLLLIEQPGVEVPAGLKGDTEYIVTKLPTVDELKQELEAFIKDAGIKLEGNGEMRGAIAGAMSGLSRNEAARLLARCWVDTKSLDPKWLRTAKAERVTERSGGAVSFVDAEGADVGGNELLRLWLDTRKEAFGSEKAKVYGLPESKGMLLVGVPGCGKSLTPRSVARSWGLPLLRLDVGKVFGSLVGQSEAQIRQAIETAEACSPCVLWLDEIEKALGGSKGGSGDSGTSTRVLGTVLTWLQEKKSSVFVIATANQVTSLPPELLRKGRFDEIFFVDLPDAVEREDIARIHVTRRKRDLAALIPKNIADICNDFSGAEIEQVIIDAMFAAYADGGREVTLMDIEAAAKVTVPLAVTMAEDINTLRKWAKGRARLAHKSLEARKPAEDGKVWRSTFNGSKE